MIAKRSTDHADASQAEAKRSQKKAKRSEFFFTFLGMFLVLGVSLLFVHAKLWGNANSNCRECTHGVNEMQFSQRAENMTKLYLTEMLSGTLLRETVGVIVGPC